MTILLTGASGFVGGSILRTARARGMQLIPAFRAHALAERVLPGGAYVHQPDLDGEADWTRALSGISVVVHCAARAHVMQDGALDPMAEYRRVNVEGTRALAQQAAAAGVRRFVFISSVKVNGEETFPEHPYTADDSPAPEDAYGISKAETEAMLRRLAAETSLEIVIIRPVMVYGPGVKGNFLTMMRCVCRGIPLPFGLVTSNRRSLVAIDNLVDLILTCSEHPAAANRTFLVSDGEDLSLADLLRRIGQAVDRPAHLLPVPAWALNRIAQALGKKAIARRLLGSLQVDINQTRELLGWTPPISVDQGLKALAGTDR